MARGSLSIPLSGGRLRKVKPIAAALVTLATSVDHGFSIPPQNSLRGPYFFFTTFFSSNADSPF